MMPRGVNVDESAATKIRTVTDAMAREVERFLYYEARLLEEGRRPEWLNLFTEDATYRIPSRESVQQTRWGGSNQTIVEEPLSFDIINDDKPGLEVRVRRLESGLAHVEVPEAVTVRLITNVEVEQLETPDTVLVRSNFHVSEMRYERSRTQPRDDVFGKRVDTLVRRDGGWRIAKRLVVVAQPVIEKGLAILL